MKHLVLGVAAALAAAVFAAAGGAAGRYQLAAGAAERSADAFAERHVAFSAHNGPDGITGEFTSIRPLPGGPGAGVTFTGEVTCLRIDGNRAVIGGIIRHSPLAAEEGTMFFAAVEDNGDPASGAPPDRVSAYDTGVPIGLETCSSATGLYTTLAPVTSGNVTVDG
jgi:hypothetical protein